MKQQLCWKDLGYLPYEEAFSLQKTLHLHCVQKTHPDTLLFQENPPTITLGRDVHEKNLLLTPEDYKSRGFHLTSVSRGGDISYHGDGQLIVSPILHFENYIPSIIQFVRCLEQIVINLLMHYGISGYRIKGLSGVFVTLPKDKTCCKIAALGIALSHGVTCHGLSINVNPNLSHFETIIPCGIDDKGVAAMAQFGTVPSLQEVRDCFITEFCELFGCAVYKNF